MGVEFPNEARSSAWGVDSPLSDKSALQKAVAMVDHATGEAAKRLQQLEIRLRPVLLLPNTEPDDEGPPELATPGSPVVTALRKAEHDLRALERDIGRILSNLEV